MEKNETVSVETETCSAENEQTAEAENGKEELFVSRVKYEAQEVKLNETLERLRRYEEMTGEIEQEFNEMQNSLTRERMKSEKAMTIAAKVYKQNTALRKRTSRLSERSHRHQKWAEESQISQLSVPNEIDENSVDDVSLGTDIVSQEIEDMKTGNSAEQQLEEARNEISHLQTQWHEVDNKLQTMIDENEKLKEAIQVHQEAETAAALELESLMNKLDLEYQVRKRAETLAAKMYGENKSWQKQSVMRKKSDGRDSDAKEKALNDALEEVKRLSEELEEEKILNQQKFEELQEIIDSSSDRQDEVDELKRREDQLLFKLRDVTNEKDLLIKKCNQLEDDLVKAKRQPRSLRPAPPPPNIPPPTPIPAPPPPPGVASNGKSLDPLSKLKQLVYQRKAARGALGGKKVNPNERKQVTHGLMVYADAMDEMMQRIKTGNVGLKKVRRYSEIPEGGDYKETEKYGTLGPSASGQFNDGLDDLKEGDVFSALRKGLKPPGTNTLGVSGRKTSEPAVPMHIRQQLRKLHTTDSDDMELEQSNENMLPPSRGLHRNVQCSVRHPKEISPELQKILDAKRAKAKKQQQSVETEESL